MCLLRTSTKRNSTKAHRTGSAPMAEVTLRRFELSDVDAMMAWASDPQVAAFCRWEPYEAAEPLLAYLRDVVLPHPRFRAICLAGEDRPVSAVSVALTADWRRGELGYVLARAHWGKGVATAATRRALRAMDGKPPLPSQQHPAPPKVSMIRRLLGRGSASEKSGADGKDRDKDEKPTGEADVGSVALERMVISFVEESAAVERPPRGSCNCFNGSNQEESDDEEPDFLPSKHASAATASDAAESLKGLMQSASILERHLLADASRLAERCGKGCKGKAECRRAVADGLRALGYDAAVCMSRWERTPTYPAGEHEYINAVVGPEAVRLIVEVNFRSQFELARSTKAYRAALQALPPLFVGTPERLGKIVAIVAEAGRQSLKKKGLHFPPWRKLEYMRAKWLAPHTRCGDDKAVIVPEPAATPVQAANFSGEFELVFDKKPNGGAAAAEGGGVGDKITVVWRPTEEASKQQQPKAKVVTGLAAVL